MTHAGPLAGPVRYGLTCVDRYWRRSRKKPTGCISAKSYVKLYLTSSGYKNSECWRTSEGNAFLKHVIACQYHSICIDEVFE